MAKQSVSVIERHLEKAVIGVTGLITLAVAVMYLIGSPNEVDFPGGTAVAPGKIKQEIRDIAQSTLEAMRNAQGDVTPAPPPPQLVIGILKRDPKLVPQYASAAQPPSPLPPAVEVTATRGKVRLASILPPGTPGVTQGRNRATLPDPEPLLTTAGGLASPNLSDLNLNIAVAPKDVTWVTIAAPIQRREQRNLFIQAGYGPDELNLLLTRVFVERQVLQPNGTWSKPEPVNTYGVYQAYEPPRVDLVQIDDGWGPTDESLASLQNFATAIGGGASGTGGYGAQENPIQASIWRPPLSPYLDAYEWKPPPVDGVTWSDWVGDAMPGSAFQETGGTVRPVRAGYDRSAIGRGGSYPRGLPPVGAPNVSGTARPPIYGGATGRTTPAGGAGTGNTESDMRRAALQEARQALDDAKKALEAKDVMLASQFVDSVLSKRDSLPANMIREAEEFEKKVAEQMSVAEREAIEEARRQAYAQQMGLTLEPDVEPLWANDLTAEPGQTYRYRVRVGVFNPYAGNPKALSEPTDAVKVELLSDWSEWSMPVTVRPDVYMFLTKAAPDTGTATLEMYKWTKGKWVRATKEFTVGEPIRFDERETGPVDTGLTVVDVVSAAQREVRTKVRKDGRFDITREDATVMLAADDRGRIIERVDVADRDNPDRDMIREEIRAQATPRERPEAPTVTPTRTPTRAPSRGPTYGPPTRGGTRR